MDASESITFASDDATPTPDSPGWTDNLASASKSGAVIAVAVSVAVVTAVVAALVIVYVPRR